MAIVFALKFLFRSTSNVGLLFKLKEGNLACQKKKLTFLLKPITVE